MVVSPTGSCVRPLWAAKRSGLQEQYVQRGDFGDGRIWTSIFYQKLAQAPLGSPRCPKWYHGVPREPKGSQSDGKDSPLGAQVAPKAPKRRPKVDPRKAK